MKHLFLLFLLPLFLTISAQDTLHIDYVDTPPQLKSEDIPRAAGISNQNDLFLRGVYNSIKYPAYAREVGVPTVVQVTYFVGLDGEISIEKTSAFTPGNGTELEEPKEEIVMMTSQVTCRLRAFGSPPAPVSAPNQTISDERLEKAFAVLEEASVASILSLPSFIPGSHDGNPVVVRFTRFFSFQML